MYCPNPSLHDKGISAAEFLESTLLQLLFLVSLEFEFHKIVKNCYNVSGSQQFCILYVINSLGTPCYILDLRLVFEIGQSILLA